MIRWSKPQETSTKIRQECTLAPTYHSWLSSIFHSRNFLSMQSITYSGMTERVNFTENMALTSLRIFLSPVPLGWSRLATSHKGISSKVLITSSSKKGNLAFCKRKNNKDKRRKGWLDAYPTQQSHDLRNNMSEILAIPLSHYQQYIYHLYLGFSSKSSACLVSFPCVVQANWWKHMRDHEDE